MIGVLFNVVYREVHKKKLQKHVTKESDGLHEHSTVLTMVELNSVSNYLKIMLS